MKTTRIFFALIFSATSLLVVAQGFLSPMNEIEFRQRLNQLAALPGGDEVKLRNFRQIIAGKSLTSQQVKLFATTVVSDFVRYQLALEAYKITADKQNFYDVYDAFATMSAVFRLHDAINSVALSPGVVQPNNPPNTRPKRPNVNYPHCKNFNNRQGCVSPLSEYNFDIQLDRIYFLLYDEARMNEARKMLNDNCLTMAQLMELVFVFENEINRLNFMKESAARIFDMENFSFATVVFSNEAFKNDWLYFGRNFMNSSQPDVPPVVVCEVPNNEMEEIKATIKKQSFSSTMKSVAKQILSSKKCFTCNQVKEIASLFSFENDKVEVIKFAYDFTIDQQNFYTLVDVLNFSSNKEDLMKFINSKK